MELYHKNPITPPPSATPPSEDEALFYILTTKSLFQQRQALLQNILTHLRKCSTSQPLSLKEAMEPLFRLDWRLKQWRAVKSSVIDLLIHITSIHPGSLGTILSVIIERIAPVEGDDQKDDNLPLPKGASTMFMEKVLLINPSSWSLVYDALERNVPFHKEGHFHHRAFIDSSLSLALLAPHGWGLKVLEMLISHYIVMDVELQQASLATPDYLRLSLIMASFTKSLLEYFKTVFCSTPPAAKRLKGTMTIIPLISLILRKFDHYIFVMSIREKGSLPLLILSLTKEYPSIIVDPLLGLLFKPMILICKLLAEGKMISEHLIKSGLQSSSYIASFLKATHDGVISKDLLLLSWSTISAMLQRLYGFRGTTTAGMGNKKYDQLFVGSLNYLMIIFINCYNLIPSNEYANLFELIFNGGDCQFLIDCNEDVLSAFIAVCDLVNFEIMVECETEDEVVIDKHQEAAENSDDDDDNSDSEIDSDEEDEKIDEKKILYLPFDYLPPLPPSPLQKVIAEGIDEEGCCSR